MGKTLYFIRHGQTQWNIEGRIQGRQNSPLTALGHAQAQTVAQYVAPLGIEALYSSPAPRARETAAHIQFRLSLPVEVDPRLYEQSFGVYEGLTFAEAASQQLDAKALFEWNTPYDAIPGNGESLYAAGQRLLSFIADMLNTPAQTIAIVTHGNSLRSLAWQLSSPKAHAARFTHPNTSLTKITLTDAGPALEYWGKVID